MSQSKYLREVSVSYNRTKHNLPESKITESSQIANYLREHIFDMTCFEYKEQFVAVFLNRNNKIIGYHVLSVGGMTSTVVDPRVLFSVALLCGATAIIISHNHPSGNTKPSQADNEITQKIKKGASLLDISLLDHIILTMEGYYSYSDEGQIL